VHLVHLVDPRGTGHQPAPSPQDTSVEQLEAAEGPARSRVEGFRRLGLYPIATSQHSSSALHQIFHHTH
jgi:hypothetical protein